MVIIKQFDKGEYQHSINAIIPRFQYFYSLHNLSKAKQIPQMIFIKMIIQLGLIITRFIIMLTRGLFLEITQNLISLMYTILTKAFLA